MNDKKNVTIRDDDFNLYEIRKIPKSMNIELPPSISSLKVNSNVLSLRYSALMIYNVLVEAIVLNYSSTNSFDLHREVGKTNSEWSIPLSSKEKLQNLYMSQVIRPAYSMNTKMKFKFISKLLNAEKDNKVMKKLVFNRFEQQKFMEKYNSEMNNHSVSDKSSRPL